MKKEYINTPEGRIHYISEGKGEVLLLLHQTPLSSDQFTDMIPLFAKHYHVIAMDTLGYGNSDRAPEGEITIEYYTQNTIHFLEALGIKKAHICGQLTGSGIAGELAAVRPDMVDKLVFLGAALYTPQERDMFLKHPHFTERFDIKEDGSFIMPIWETNRTGAPNMRPETIYRMFVANLIAGPLLHDAHLAAFRYDKAPRLPLIKSPVLIISGDADMFSKKLDEVKSLIPRCKTHVVSGKTFAYCYDKPRELSQLVIDFLKKQ